MGGEVGRVTFTRAVVCASTSDEEEETISQYRKLLSRKRRCRMVQRTDAEKGRDERRS